VAPLQAAQAQQGLLLARAAVVVVLIETEMAE